MNLLVFSLALSFVSYISCQSACNSHKTCGTCIGYANERCVWCSENKKISAFRCQPQSYMKTNADWCKTEYIYYPSSHMSKKDEKFSTTVQFLPHKIKIKASPGVDVKFNVSFQRAEHFPLDVYFLMDYSYTMRAHRQALMEQAMDIYKGLTKMTRNVLLGVGSFVEKPGLPYTDIHVASNTYAFRNHLSLTTDMKKFERVISGSEFGSNYDDAEAGLDALMQVMTCEKKLGWRKDTRRIIVLATDNTYHSAGDGKMLGAIKPNDMMCHLKDNEYRREDSIKYDYPSVSLINKVARDHSFLIIFAGLPNVKTIYEDLSKQISGSKYAVLQEKSNILEIIKAAYEESVNEVKINYDAPEQFRVTIDQECNAKPKRNCEITPNRSNIEIPVTIRSTECPKTHKPEIIEMNPMGLQEKLTITFEVDCECDCEKNFKTDTRKNCNKNGFIQCGACKCDKDWGGDSCEVSCSDETSIVLEKKCLPANSTSKCSGHGTCECGKCTCTDGFTGDVCEYDPNSCNTGSNGKICGGKSHGTCRFGKCDCEADWTGKACDCLVEEKSLKQCTGPFSEKICSGRGRCDCGKCICNKVGHTNEKYSGTFCDLCAECAIERCQELEGYAKCNQKQTKVVCDKKFDKTDEINLEVIVENKSELAKRDEWRTGTQCRTPLDDGTFLLFKYIAGTKPTLEDPDIKTSRLLLMIQKETEVPPKADLLVPIAGAIAGILLIGLLTVVFWRVLIELYDKREYSKFCEEAQSQGFDVSQNPLYEPPTQNFVNPGFNQDTQ